MKLTIWNLGIRGWFRVRRRARAEEALGAHLVETAAYRTVTVRVPGHAEPGVHDGLPLHRHDQRTGIPIAVFPS